MSNLLEALKQIDVSQLSYDEWISVGMALKAEGYDCSVWDEWSQNDTRYKKGECERNFHILPHSIMLSYSCQIVKLFFLAFFRSLKPNIRFFY